MRFSSLLATRNYPLHAHPFTPLSLVRGQAHDQDDTDREDSVCGGKIDEADGNASSQSDFVVEDARGDRHMPYFEPV